MSLYSRLLGIDLPRIQVHAFMAALGEVERARVTLAQVATAFGLNAGETTEMETLASRILTPSESVAFGSFLTLNNIGTTYDATAVSKGLGFCSIQTGGIVEATFMVKVSKVGSGTQSWQLWNETDVAELGVINDAGAAGDKDLLTVITPSQPLGAGFKTLRVRAKSTVAQDDPIYYGATVRLKRADKLTSMELHEVLLLGEGRFAYGTEAALKSRLGV